MSLTNLNPRTWFLALIGLSITTAACAAATHSKDRTEYRAPFAATAPVIDGVADEEIWAKARWQPLIHRWLGPEFSPEDFNGQYEIERMALNAAAGDVFYCTKPQT